MSVRLFLPGDPVPFFTCPSTNNPTFHFDTAAGRYVVLSFLGADVGAVEDVPATVTGALRPFFDDRKTAFFGVSTNPADAPRLTQMVPGIRYFHDYDGAVSRLYGAWAEDGSYRPFTLVLDPSFRVLANLSLEDMDWHNRTLLAVLRGLPALDGHAGVPLTAPVLVVPRVLEPEFCRELISLYEKHGGEESGSMTEKDGYTVGKIDYNFKRRRDYTIEDESVRAQLRARLVRRLVPEVQKAFQFRATHIERYIVACYDGGAGGFFRAHRDNTTKGTAHRRFACTINLNAEDYEGGELRFPEFGTRTYRAPTGGAVVFSCSLLHEALPVTKGVRYATLPFLYDAEGAKIREENARFLTGEVLRTGESGA